MANQRERVTAGFDSANEAEEAVRDLRQAGVPEDRMGLIMRDQDQNKESTAEGIGKGAAVGGGLGGALGLIAGIGTGFIPGVGPFIAAGVLTGWLGTVAGSAVSGAVVGGTAGTIAGALEERAGYSKGEAEYYGNRVENGGTLVAVETSGIEENNVLATMRQHHGSTQTAPRA